MYFESMYIAVRTWVYKCQRGESKATGVIVKVTRNNGSIVEIIYISESRRDVRAYVIVCRNAVLYFCFLISNSCFSSSLKHVDEKRSSHGINPLTLRSGWISTTSRIHRT